MVAFRGHVLEKVAKNSSVSLRTHAPTMDTSGWRTIKRNAPNAPKRVPSIAKRQCKEKDNDEVDIEPAVTTANVEPTGPLTDGASSPVSDER